MKFITGTPQHLSEAFRHYLCMRMRFRSTVLSDAPAKPSCPLQDRQTGPESNIRH